MSPHKRKMCLFVDVHSTWLAQTVWQTTDGNCNPACLPTLVPREQEHQRIIYLVSLVGEIEELVV